MDGERKYGYGVDVLRAWAAFKDSDKNTQVSRDQLDKVNKEVKLFRDVLRVLLTHVHQGLNSPYSTSTPIAFDKLLMVDKLFLVRLLEFTREITQCYERFDLKEVYSKTLDFVVRDVTDFYLDFSKYRRRRLIEAAQKQQGVRAAPEMASMLQVVSQVYLALLQTGAPILPFTAQEAYD
jgi:isoleucyl-tRNA synthetase